MILVKEVFKIKLGVTNSNAYSGHTGNFNVWFEAGKTVENGGDCDKVGSLCPARDIQIQVEKSSGDETLLPNVWLVRGLYLNHRIYS
jgi:hypothetical protein